MYKFILIILISIIPLAAQPVDSLINLAINNNPLLKSYKAKVLAIQNRAEAVNQLPPPSLSIEFNQIPFNSLNIWNESESNSISLSQMFMLGGKLGAMKDVELKNINIETANSKIAAINIIAGIKMNYYNLWITERKIEIQERIITTLEQLINNLNVQLSINKINQADILALTGEIFTNKTQVANLINEKQKYINSLNRFLGFALDTISTSTDISTQANIDEKYLLDYLSSNNPILVKMDAMSEMNKAMINANNRDKIPDLMVQGMLMRMPLGMPLYAGSDLSMTSMDGNKTEYMYSIMASVTLPFAPWSANKYKFKEEELLATIKGIQYEKEDMRNEMLNNLKNSIIKFKNSKNLLQLYSDNVIPVYENTLNLQILTYQTSRSNLTAVIDAVRMLLMQHMNYYMAQADIQMSLAEIEMMAGSSIINLNLD